MKRSVLITLVAILAGGAVLIGATRFVGGATETTDDAYVGGNQVQITPQVAGTVVALYADDTDFVRSGELLIALDDTDARIALAQAKAALARTVRQVSQLFDTVSELQAQVRLRRAQFEQAQEDYERRHGAQSGAVTVEDLAHSRLKLSAARAAVDAAGRALAVAQARTLDTTIPAHPLVLQAEARVRAAYLALSRTRIHSPVTGYVARRTAQIGDRVSPGSPLLTVVPLDQIWVDANFKETELRNVRIGQPARVVADFYGDHVTYDGRVVGLAAGTGASFALVPPQNATGNWIKIVQRLPVRLTLDPRQVARKPLRLGLSMQVSIDTRKRNGGVLALAPRSRSAYATSVYDQQLHGVDRLITGIITANCGQCRYLHAQNR
ncbi:MAG TPA: efflux RND transporter periplasmic adaptor subunit [Steroidobacteraceae bacterium]|nr:efflux RND transporter periplasmic adaptor subunit [Steroidobacteraceae bacterium]